MKEKNVAGILALFLGGLGIHKFYLGNWILGFIYLFFSWTWIPCILGIIESIIIFMMNDDEFDIKYNGKEPPKEKKKSKKQLEKEEAEDDEFRKYFLIGAGILILAVIALIIYMGFFAEHKTF